MISLIKSSRQQICPPSSYLHHSEGDKTAREYCRGTLKTKRLQEAYSSGMDGPATVLNFLETEGGLLRVKTSTP